MPISNLGNGLRTGVCTSTNRPTTPYEGQVIYETDTDLSYIWGGTAWQQVSGGTAVGNSGLVYVTSTTVGTGVSSVTVSSAFSSTYDNYAVVINNVSVNSASNYLRLSLNAITANHWYGNGYSMTAGNTTMTGISTAGVASARIAVGDAYTFVSVNIYSPFIVDYPAITSTYITGGGSAFSGSFQQSAGSTASNTAFTVFADAGTLTGGTIRVYGYRQ